MSNGDGSMRASPPRLVAPTSSQVRGRMPSSSHRGPDRAFVRASGRQEPAGKKTPAADAAGGGRAAPSFSRYGKLGAAGIVASRPSPRCFGLHWAARIASAPGKAQMRAGLSPGSSPESEPAPAQGGQRSEVPGPALRGNGVAKSHGSSGPSHGVECSAPVGARTRGPPSNRLRAVAGAMLARGEFHPAFTSLASGIQRRPPGHGFLSSRHFCVQRAASLLSAGLTPRLAPPPLSISWRGARRAAGEAGVRRGWAALPTCSTSVSYQFAFKIRICELQTSAAPRPCPSPQRSRGINQACRERLPLSVCGEGDGG
jgi:hypothetical protein